jgi:hypothetical protein
MNPRKNNINKQDKKVSHVSVSFLLPFRGYVSLNEPALQQNSGSKITTISTHAAAISGLSALVKWHGSHMAHTASVEL